MQRRCAISCSGRRGPAPLSDRPPGAVDRPPLPRGRVGVWGLLAAGPTQTVRASYSGWASGRQSTESDVLAGLARRNVHAAQAGRKSRYRKVCPFLLVLGAVAGTSSASAATPVRVTAARNAS